MVGWLRHRERRHLGWQHPGCGLFEKEKQHALHVARECSARWDSNSEPMPVTGNRSTPTDPAGMRHQQEIDIGEMGRLDP